MVQVTYQGDCPSNLMTQALPKRNGNVISLSSLTMEEMKRDNDDSARGKMREVDMPRVTKNEDGCQGKAAEEREISSSP